MKMKHISTTLKPKPRFLLRRQKRQKRLVLDNEFFSEGYASRYYKLRIVEVYCVLAKYANYKRQDCWPSYKVIMSESGITNRNTLKRALDKLEELNIIWISHSTGRSSNGYVLMDVEVWKERNSIKKDTVERYRNGVKFDQI